MRRKEEPVAFNPRTILVILDGLADRSYPELGHRTPLQEASTPMLDSLAAYGQVGLYHALRPGVPLASETAHFIMMGYRPEDFPGRGLLEALGFGVEFGPGDVLFLTRLVSLEPKEGELVLSTRKPRLTEEEAALLFEEVGSFEAEGCKVEAHPTGKGGGILVVKGDASPHVTDTEPFIRGMPLVMAEPLEEHSKSKSAHSTARLINEYLIFAHQRLESHPVNRARLKEGLVPLNGLTTQRPGRAGELEPLEARLGLRVLSISSAALYAGLFSALGARSRLVEERETPEEEISRKVEEALGSLDEFHLVHVHTKAPDHAAHTKDPGAKVAAIESLDRGLGGLYRALGKRPDLVVAVTSDHATPSSGKMIHSGEPSPLLIAGGWAWRDGVREFDEVSCSAGSLGLLRGDELILTLVSLMDRGKLSGLRDNPKDLIYYPGPRRSLKVPE